MAKAPAVLKVVVVEGPMFQQARQNAFAAANRIMRKKIEDKSGTVQTA